MSQCGRLCSTHQDRLIHTNNVDVEWVEDFQIPKSFYSRPTPGRENFVRGCKEYSIPADPRKKITGFRRDYFPVQNLELRRQVQLAKEEERKRIQENSNQKPLNIVMFWLSTLSQRELTKTLFVRLLCWPECFTSMNSVSILSWWWPCRVFGGALWPFLLPWPIDFPNKAEGARTRAPIVHFNPCNFFPSRRRNNWSRPKSGGGESHKGLNHFQVGRGGGSHILQEA